MTAKAKAPSTPAGAPEEKEIRLGNITLAKALWPFIKPYAWMLGLTTLLVFAVTFFELVMPLLTQKAFDGFILPVDPRNRSKPCGR